MGFIHSRNMCQKEVDYHQQTLGRVHTRWILAHNKIIKDGRNWRSSSQDSKKKEKIPQVMRNMYSNLEGFNSWRTSYPSQHLDKKWCSCEWRRWWKRRLKDIRIKKGYTHQTNKDKCSIFISWYCLVCICLYSVDVLCMFVCLHLYYWIAHDG